jgi:hypothetical protein
MIPDNPLWTLASRLAEWLDRQGFYDYRKELVAWTGDTSWRDDGILPSGDRFTVWIICEL